MSTSHADRMSSVPLMNLHERRNHHTNAALEPDYDWSDQEVEEFSRDPLESVLMQMRLWPQAISRQQCVQSALFFSAIALCVGFVLAYLLFLFFYPAVAGCPFVNEQENNKVVAKLMQNVDFEQLNEFFKINATGDVIGRNMEDMGLDNVIVGQDVVGLIEPDEKLSNWVILRSKEDKSFQANCTNHLRFCNLSIDTTKEIGDAEFIFANLGRPQDYEHLISRSIELRNKIFVVRTSSVPLWRVVHVATIQGALGLVLFSLQSSYDLDFDDPLDLFPANIPIQFIGLDDAKVLLNKMKGKDAPDDWQFTKDVKIKMDSSLNEEYLSISVHNQKKYHKTRNVVGVIKGEVEPDRFVLIGSERGHAEGSSSLSSALLLELARVFGSLHRSHKLQARRTMLFCVWDSVHGYPLGITKWLQKNSEWRRENMVAYINVDAIIAGDSSIQTWTVPSLLKFFNKSAEKVSRFDFKHAHALTDYHQNDTESYQTSNFSEGSKRFLSIGVPVVDIRSKITDSELKKNHQFLINEIHLVIELASLLTNSVVLPFDMSDYASVFNETVKQSQKMATANKNLIQDLIFSYRNFSRKAIDFQSNVKSITLKNPFHLRALNDQIMAAETLLSQLSTTDPCNINSNKFENVFSCTTHAAKMSSVECRIMKIASILDLVTGILTQHF